MHIYTNSSIQTITLSQAVAPIFRQLCPEPPGAPINLSSLLQHSLRSLRQYVGINLICSVLSDMPTLFRYQVAMPSSQPYNHHPSLPAIQEDGVIQWLYGIPNQLLLLFATMKTMNQDGLLPSEEMVASLERDIREVPPFTGSSSDRFLAVVRSVVQECWRQAALVYLYMGVCRDSSNTPRVKDAFKRLVRLLNGTRPGRLPDEFLTSPLMIISPAAQQRRDREIIRERAVRLHARASPTNDYIMRIIEDYWSRADAEGRPNMWSDIAVSRRQVLGV
ncbi:hypothetical protein B0J17DRAFT_640303 [Rhizoctonia solani]|nr:hypothetical protein B0J17DRAFT_640303 [Rhizoctonia solani]